MNITNLRHQNCEGSASAQCSKFETVLIPNDKPPSHTNDEYLITKRVQISDKSSVPFGR